MGYTPGKGIGKHGTGISEPISESIHKGRRGLGFTLEGLEKEDVEWELEDVSHKYTLYQLFWWNGVAIEPFIVALSSKDVCLDNMWLPPISILTHI